MADNKWWHKLTPWDEGAGETLRSEVKERLPWSTPKTHTYSFSGVRRAPEPTMSTPTGRDTSLWSGFGDLAAQNRAWEDTVRANAALTMPVAQTSPNEMTRVRSINGWDFMEFYNNRTGQWDTYPEPLGRTDTTQDGITPYQQSQIGLSEQRLQAELAAQQAEAAYRQQQLAWQREQQQAQLAAEKEQRLAQLAAEPKSWLEYAALAGQPPVIQPWMMPLMPSDYGISAGEQIPGWTPTGMTGMPSLTTPSAQYQARMGPTAQQQYLGYEQARTGSIPQETQWRLWSMAPPSGRNMSLSYQR